MKTIYAHIEQIIESIGKLVSWLSLLLVALVGIDVALRYLFNWNSSANQEMEWHLFATLFLLGAAYTLKHDKHVRVDVFYARFGDRGRTIVNLIGASLFLIPFSSVIFITSIPFVQDAYHIGESSAEPGGLPHRFIIKSMIPFGALLLFMQAIAEILKSITQLTNRIND